MRKIGLAGLALAVAGALIFTAGFIGARGDMSVVNGSMGPFRVQLADGQVHSGSGGSKSGLGGGRDKPLTTPPPASPAATATIYSDGSHHDEHGEQHRADSADCRSFPAGDVRKIVLDIDFADVALLPSSGADVYVSCDRLDDFTVSLDKGGTLKVDSRNKITVFSLGSDSRPALSVTVPESLCCSLEADVDCGNIQLENLSLEKLKLDSDMGDVYVYGVECAGAELSSNCGSVQAYSVTSSGRLEIDSDMGDVTVENCSAAAELKVDSNCGRVTVNGCSAKSAELDADMGDIGAYWLSVTGTVKLDCDCGAIEFKGLSAGKSIEIHNSMGAISGTLPGSITDYSIESGADLGSNNLPSELELGGIKLKVHDSCGSIDVRFEDD